MLAETAAPATPSPTRSTAARASRRPQTRVRAFRAQSVDYKYRARRVVRRRPSGKSASVRRLASDAGFYLFDGIDHPLRIKQGTTTAYYELDLAGNVRGLRASGGASLGDYRYSAFGQTLEDTTSITQPLRWKGRWFSPVAGGTYDVRARQWSPELGIFLSVDEFGDLQDEPEGAGAPGSSTVVVSPGAISPAIHRADIALQRARRSGAPTRSGFGYHDLHSTLWGWPGQSPILNSDPFGHGLPELKKCLASAKEGYYRCVSVPVKFGGPGALSCAIIWIAAVQWCIDQEDKPECPGNQ